MKFFTDGFTKLKNPSPVGGGYSILDEENTVLNVENIDKAGFTNNEAELLAVHHCLEEWCTEGDTISTDSMNTIQWINTKKIKKVARQDLVEIILRCKSLIEEKMINLIWEGREHNLAGIYNEEQGLDTFKKQNQISSCPDCGSGLKRSSIFECSKCNFNLVRADKK